MAKINVFATFANVTIAGTAKLRVADVTQSEVPPFPLLLCDYLFKRKFSIDVIIEPGQASSKASEET